MDRRSAPTQWLLWQRELTPAVKRSRVVASYAQEILGFDTRLSVIAINQPMAKIATIVAPISSKCASIEKCPEREASSQAPTSVATAADNAVTTRLYRAC